MIFQDVPNHDLVMACNDAERGANIDPLLGIRLHRHGVGAAVHEGQASV